MKTTTNVPIRADRAYVNRLKKLAVNDDKHMADLVRAACDSFFGDKLAEPANSLLVSDVPSTEQIPA